MNSTRKIERRLEEVESQLDDVWFWCFVVCALVGFTAWKFNGLSITPQSSTTEQTTEQVSEFKPSKDAPKFRYPFASKVPLTSGFGMRIHPITKESKMHSGIDLSAALGTPIYAIADGKVESAGDMGGCGTGIRIEHSGGYLSVYCHNSKNLVRVGQSVKAGQEIGLVGSTGMSTGPHLHLGIKKDGQWIDPKKVVPLQ